MIGLFPKAYPDELFYGILARFHMRMGSRSTAATNEQLFGSKVAAPSLYFPSRLGSLMENLPAWSALAVDDIVEKHTILPFYQGFLSKSRVDLIKHEMVSGKGYSVFRLIGQQASSIPVPRNLRFCPECLKDDYIKYGESYWHRSHQLAGVLVCIKHGCILYESRVSLQTHEYITVSPEYCNNGNKGLNVSDVTLEYLYRITTMANWLLTSNLVPRDERWIRERYRFLLRERGFGTKLGSIRDRDLAQHVRTKVPNELLEIFRLKENLLRWVQQMYSIDTCSFHPIRHLVLLSSLDVSLQDFFTFGLQSEVRNEVVATIEPEFKLKSEDELKRRRVKWYKLVQSNPQACKTNLVNLDPATYAWLKKYDEAWLLDNVPEPVVKWKHKGRSKSVDWASRDEELLSLTKSIVSTLLNSDEIPVRITGHRIAEKSDRPFWFRKLSLLPKTKRYLEDIQESIGQFHIRRIQWAMEELQNDGEPITKSRVLATAKLSNNLSDEAKHVLETFIQ